MNPPYRGSCLCGAVKFEIDEFMTEIGRCHCSMCRKFHGAEFATLAGVLDSKFRWLSGEDDLKQYTASNSTSRKFCSHCGSSITFSTPQAPQNIIEIAIGLMDDAIPVKPDAHIFVGSCGNWTEFSNDLPKFEKGRDSQTIGR